MHVNRQVNRAIERTFTANRAELSQLNGPRSQFHQSCVRAPARRPRCALRAQSPAASRQRGRRAVSACRFGSHHPKSEPNAGNPGRMKNMGVEYCRPTRSASGTLITSNRKADDVVAPQLHEINASERRKTCEKSGWAFGPVGQKRADTHAQAQFQQTKQWKAPSTL
eukprot:2805399-Pleurochrysis_carterae.AAC.2